MIPRKKLKKERKKCRPLGYVHTIPVISVITYSKFLVHTASEMLYILWGVSIQSLFLGVLTCSQFLVHTASDMLYILWGVSIQSLLLSVITYSKFLVHIASEMLYIIWGMSIPSLLLSVITYSKFLVPTASVYQSRNIINSTGSVYTVPNTLFPCNEFLIHVI